MKTKKKKIIKEIALQPTDKQSERENDLLGLIVSSPLTQEEKYEKAFALFVNTGVNMLWEAKEPKYFIVLNGVIGNIKIFPLLHMVVFKQNGTQYFITTSFINMIEMIKGNLSFK